MASGIIAAAGKGTRMGAKENKVFLKINEKTVLEHTVLAFLNCPEIEEIIIVTGKEDIKRCEELFSDFKKPIKIVCGGKTRKESVYNGIVASECEIVAIHDGARALITPELITKVIKECKTYKAATLGVVAKDTIKIVSDDGFIKETPDRNYTYQIQTPQVFERKLIIKAHRENENFNATDDSSLVEKMGIKVKVVSGSYENIKLTTIEDMLIAKEILNSREK